MPGWSTSAPLDPGELRYQVTLERDQLTWVNGVEARSPQVYGTPYAKVEYLSGSEIFKDQQVSSRTILRVTMPYREDIKKQDRLYFRGERMEIKAVLPDAALKTKVVLECWSQ